ncbi:MAG: M48 family metalloprotease [Pirellulales bacterium]|nr:M48 family metalloprotease [Pirellulales bacterium]
MDAGQRTGSVVSQDTPSEEPPALTPADIAAALAEPIAPIPKSRLYRLGLAVVAIMMVLLPGLYLLLLATIAYAMYWYASVGVAQAMGHRPGAYRAVFAVAPLFAGVTVLVFMIKPILARRQQRFAPHSIALDDQPLLRAVLEALCQRLGAPFPQRVDLDCNVNASAGFRRGLRSTFSKDLVLTIGLPLVYGLSLREFTGVLAHELGHFAQGGGLRLSYVIRALNDWFARLVFERDAWDQRLASASQLGVPYILLLVAMCRFAVFLSRCVLWVFMVAGHAISAFLMRQMEYDADRYEAQVCGVESFRATMEQLPRLSTGQRLAYDWLQVTYAEGRLAANLPQLMCAASNHPAAEILSKTAHHDAKPRTKWLETHPADEQRIAAAERTAAPGICNLPGPATALFAHLDSTAEQVTREHYQVNLAVPWRAEMLTSTPELLAILERAEAQRTAASRLFPVGISTLRPVPMPAAASDEPDGWRKQLRDGAGQMATHFDAYRQAMEDYHAAFKGLFNLQQAGELLRARVPVNAASVGLRRVNDATLRQRRETYEQQLNEAISRMEPYEQAAGDRLRSGLKLACDGGSGTHVEEARRRGELTLLLPTLEAFARARERLFALHQARASLLVLVINHEKFKRKRRFREQQETAVAGLLSTLAENYRSWCEVAYPFADLPSGTSIAQAVFKQPPGDDAAAVSQAAEQVLSKLEVLYGRLLQHSALIVLDVEQSTGLNAAVSGSPGATHH